MARFYISSTSSDLQSCREHVYRMLRRIGHDVAAMEDYVASNQTPLDRCLADVASCDVYIGIVAWRYGFVPAVNNPDRLSITELEYREARRRDLACLVFLLSPAAPWPREARDELPTVGSERRTVAHFKEDLCNEHLVSFFENEDQLALLASIAVRKWEIETGYRTPVPALSDQVFPKELRILKYIPGKSLTVKAGRGTELGCAYLFMIIFLFMASSFVVAAIQSRTSGLIIISSLFLAAGASSVFFRPRIKFDLANKRTRVNIPGAISWSSPSVGSLHLKTKNERRGWRSTLSFSGLTIVRTNTYPTRDEARNRLLPFATALNYILGFLNLKED